MATGVRLPVNRHGNRPAFHPLPDDVMAEDLPDPGLPTMDDPDNPANIGPVLTLPGS